MYTLLRKCHLYAGLTILLFLMMYFVTGYALIHAPWFGSQNPKPQTVIRTESLSAYTGPRTPEPLASYVTDHFNLHGRLTIPPPDQQPKNAIRFTISHPGTTVLVDIPNDSAAATLRTTHENLQGILVQLHRIHGYGGSWLFNLWALLNDLASASCILFALTGVYLWWKSTKHHLAGALCLAASCLYGFGMIVYLLFAK